MNHNVEGRLRIIVNVACVNVHFKRWMPGSSMKRNLVDRKSQTALVPYVVSYVCGKLCGQIGSRSGHDRRCGR